MLIIKFRQLTYVCLLLLGCQVQAQETPQYLRFSVIAMAPYFATRVAFEEALVSMLRLDNYDAVPSHSVLPVEIPAEQSAARELLLDAGIHAVLVLQPLASGEGGSITAAQAALSPESYGSLSSFISDYRGDNFESQAVVHVMGFLLDEQQSRLFWQGVVWLDESVDTQQEAIDKLVNLVRFNLNQSRPALRQYLGFPPLDTSNP